MRDVCAEQLDAAARGHETADGVHERRLAGAVRADQADDLVRTDADGDVVDRDAPAESYGHAVRREHVADLVRRPS